MPRTAWYCIFGFWNVALARSQPLIRGLPTVRRGPFGGLNLTGGSGPVHTALPRKVPSADRAPIEGACEGDLDPHLTAP